MISGFTLTTSAPTLQTTSSSGQAELSPSDVERSAAGTSLDQHEQKEIRELQARDREVRAHEQAHLTAAGGHAIGGARYTYERGPDSRMYAVGGEVSVDTSKIANDPVATLRKAQTLRRAALAPVSPSAQDRRVAAEASQMEAEARRELSTHGDNNSDLGGEVSLDPPFSTQTDASDSSLQTCAACGGAHTSGAHDGITAYAAQPLPEVGRQVNARS